MFLLGALAAAQLYGDAAVKRLFLYGQELKIGWGKPSPVPGQVTLAIKQRNASRGVYLGGLDENAIEERLGDDLNMFGLIDRVKIVSDQNIGLVRSLSISIATRVRSIALITSYLHVTHASANIGRKHAPYGALLGMEGRQIRQGSMRLCLEVSTSSRGPVSCRLDLPLAHPGSRQLRISDDPLPVLHP